MKTVTSDETLIARCGLYCGACGSYLKEKCPGCERNESATWCAVRTCCRDHGYGSCADCTEHPDPKACGKFHSWISRVIGFVLRSDRARCIAAIRKLGRKEYAASMARDRTQTLRP